MACARVDIHVSAKIASCHDNSYFVNNSIAQAQASSPLHSVVGLDRYLCSEFVFRGDVRAAIGAQLKKQLEARYAKSKT